MATLAMLATLLLAPSAARAQQGVIRGRVVTPDATGRPVGAAEVVLPGLERTVRSGEDGAFQVDSVPAGTHEVVARKLGFEPVTRRVTLAAGDTVTLVLALPVRVQALAQVDVRDRAAAPAVRAFERERAIANGGAFISDSLLAKNQHSPMSNVLRRIPGATIVRVPSNSGGYNALGSSRGRQSLRGSKYCFYQIYVDGQRYFAPTSANIEPPPDVDEFKVADYEAIEVYRGAAQTPSQYGGTGAPCGTILFWSRTRVAR
ncbi:hypothetical protein rosag_30500 [Roseisolibacter agri]|uniref:TonB-dependent receptor plug domain-containing protein n=2 Tax=Roseisolibacter agri TaxID=2014610 RepID=A0AA37QA54_9BACT|nr:hypothetical protein rosag_30500 [Roseisolibacter agri]